MTHRLSSMGTARYSPTLVAGHEGVAASIDSAHAYKIPSLLRWSSLALQVTRFRSRGLQLRGPAWSPSIPAESSVGSRHPCTCGDTCGRALRVLRSSSKNNERCDRGLAFPVRFHSGWASGIRKRSNSGREEIFTTELEFQIVYTVRS